MLAGGKLPLSFCEALRQRNGNQNLSLISNSSAPKNVILVFLGDHLRMLTIDLLEIDPRPDHRLWRGTAQAGLNAAFVQGNGTSPLQSPFVSAEFIGSTC